MSHLEPCRIKHTEEQTDLMVVKEESQELLEEKHNFIPGEKSFSCSLIDNNNKSQKLGRVEKKFICPQCAKSFTQKISLERYMLIHTGRETLHLLSMWEGF